MQRCICLCAYMYTQVNCCSSFHITLETTVTRYHHGMETSLHHIEIDSPNIISQLTFCSNGILWSVLNGTICRMRSWNIPRRNCQITRYILVGQIGFQKYGSLEGFENSGLWWYKVGDREEARMWIELQVPDHGRRRVMLGRQMSIFHYQNCIQNRQRHYLQSNTWWNQMSTQKNAIHRKKAASTTSVFSMSTSNPFDGWFMERRTTN